MKNYTVEILFALYMRDGIGTMDWLVAFACGEKDAGDACAVASVKQSVGRLASAGLVTLALVDMETTVALTDKGTLVALAAADLISDQMIAEWKGDEGDETQIDFWVA